MSKNTDVSGQLTLDFSKPLIVPPVPTKEPSPLPRPSYYDIMMQNNGGKGCNIIMELKKSKSRNQLEHDAEEAIKQIMSRDYAHGLKGQTVIYGIAFFGKEPHIISDVL